jgi:hypothetical protein
MSDHSGHENINHSIHSNPSANDAALLDDRHYIFRVAEWSPRQFSSTAVDAIHIRQKHHNARYVDSYDRQRPGCQLSPKECPRRCQL